MPTSRTAHRSRLDVSSRATLLFVDGGYALTVAQLCERLGVPERTFYNYFPTKADAIRPVLERGIEAIAATITGEPPERPLVDALIAGFESSLWGAAGVHTKRIVPLVLSTPPLYAVWLSTIQSFEATLADAIRPRVGLEADSVAERMVAATLVSAVRISFEHMATHGTEPVATLRDALRAVVVPAPLDR